MAKQIFLLSHCFPSASKLAGFMSVIVIETVPLTQN